MLDNNLVACSALLVSYSGAGYGLPFLPAVSLCRFPFEAIQTLFNKPNVTSQSSLDLVQARAKLSEVMNMMRPKVVRRAGDCKEVQRPEFGR